MRLKHLKIAGFKSFVEPTKLVLPSNLIGIVGPNGCGKSNTLDAVRWVMGESSAKQLRGGDMNDVLFNGTDKRKPVSQCSVELVFDNEDGLLTGEFASFSEISVKRVHHREDGTSYFLNQQKVRRRDVLDLFNGTGLGPRSYALIGQGNISQIIEAKPEDMRVYLEEVAGIGPYKSRRKETLLRLEKTRENLAQLAVLQDALSEQAINLEIQAEKALQYREAIKLQKTLEKSVFYLQWQARQNQLKVAQTQLQNSQQKFAQTKFAWDEAQKNYLLTRQQQLEVQQKLEELEVKFHQADKDLLQASQQHLFANQQSQQWLSQQELNLAQSRQYQQELADLSQQLAEIQEEKLAVEYEIERIEAEQEQQDQVWLNQQKQLKQAQEALQQANWQLNSANQKHQQAKQEFLRLEQAIDYQQQQIELLSSTQTQDFSAQITELTTNLLLLEDEFKTLETELNQLQPDLVAGQKQLADLELVAKEQEQALQSLSAEQQALERIQQASFSGSSTDLAELLASGKAKRLIDLLQVDAQWQLAVENWLGDKLQGLVFAENYDLAKLPEVGFVGFDQQNLPTNLPDDESCLASKIHAPAFLKQLAKDIFITENFADSTHNFTEQKPQNSHNQIWLLDKNGVLFNQFAVIKPIANSAQGLLTRKQRLEEISLEINNLTEQAKETSNKLTEAKTAQTALQNQQAEIQNNAQAVERNIERLKDQLAHFEQQQTLAQNQLAQQKTSQSQAQEKLASQQQQLSDLQLEISANEESVWQFEDEQETKQAELEKLENSTQPLQREREKLEQNWQRLNQQLGQQNQNISQLNFQKNQLSQQIKQNQLQADLIAKNLAETKPVEAEEIKELEQQLADLKQALTEQQAINSELNQQLEQLNLEAETKREINQQAQQDLLANQLQIENLQDAIQTLKQSIEANGLSVHELAQIRLEEDKSDHLEADLKQIKLKISQLGAVNMTAIEEFERVSNQLNQLETQLQDLEDSIATLEGAIATIDKDSRARLLATFEQVNLEFSQLFPKLFNGGNASLSWQDLEQDPLEGGVEVMAQPPGKRNSRIALLSGGEKTLSALALIFAIFQLKPAPFCILDEVDAPLDDANVIRFCNLVKSLAEKVQFIFITHNKTTMTMAQQLIGVTMHEAGVSRLVSVDLDAAVAMIGDEI